MRLTFSPIAARRLRLTLEEPVETPDGIGGVTRAFAPRVTLWARIEPLLMAERGLAQRIESAVTHRITIRWRADVTPAMRFAENGRFYDIRAVFDPDGARRELVCHVEEVR